MITKAQEIEMLEKFVASLPEQSYLYDFFVNGYFKNDMISAIQSDMSPLITIKELEERKTNLEKECKVKQALMSELRNKYTDAYYNYVSVIEKTKEIIQLSEKLVYKNIKVDPELPVRI